MYLFSYIAVFVVWVVYLVIMILFSFVMIFISLATYLCKCGSPVLNTILVAYVGSAVKFGHLTKYLFVCKKDIKTIRPPKTK